MVNYHTWKTVLPCKENAMCSSHSHCHVWLILKAMPCAVTRDEKTHYTHCFEAYVHCIINDNSHFTGMADAPYQLCRL